MAKTLSTRLTYRIMAVVLAMMSVIAGVVYFTVRKYMQDEAKARYLGLLLENHQEVRRWLADVCVAVDNNVHDIERDIDHPDALFTHMERIVRQNPTIACCAMLFLQDYYAEKGRVFVPCARRDAADSVRVSRIDSTYNSYFYGEWFQQQMQKDERSWTQPYTESQQFAGDQEPRLLATYTVPIHDRDGRPVALLAADLSLEEMRGRMVNDIMEIQEQYEKGLRNHSYFFVLDRAGTIIIHPDHQRMLTNFDREVGKMMKMHRGTCVTKVDGVESRLYYRNIPETGWVILIVSPEEVVLSNANQLNVIILAVMFLGLLAIYLFCRRQIKGIADPIAMQKATLEHELKIAHDIQMAMLPQDAQHSPLNAQLPDQPFSLAASLTPARDVGGDLYDFFQRDNRLFFCIGDVSGKGVPAALMMAVIRAMFRGEARRTISAAAIVDTINHNLSEEYTAGYFVTLFVGILDLTTGQLDYCNAGHEPPISLPVLPNLPVGALPDWDYEGQQAQLQPGELLFLYTDGLSEAMNTAGEQLGRKRVQQLVHEHRDDTPQQLIAHLETIVRSHLGTAPQNDDITLLAIRWQPSLSLRACMDDITLLEPYLASVTREAGLSDKKSKRLRLAAEEALANIVNHGEATTINLRAATEPASAQNVEEPATFLLTITDDGQPFDPTGDSPTDFSVPPDKRPPGGLGIMLIHQMTDALHYERTDNHNVLTLKYKCHLNE